MRFLSKHRALLGGIVLCQASAFRPLFTRKFAWNAAHRYNGVACSKMRPAARTSPRMGFKSPFVALKEGIARTLAGDYDEKGVKEAIGQYIDESKVVVFSWTRSPFCKKAKGLLTDLIADPSDYKFVELDERNDGNAIRYELSQMTGRTSVPHIWINGEFVGGCNDGPGVTTLMDRGELVPKLEAAGCRLK